MESLFPEMEAEIRQDRTAARREHQQRARDWLAKHDLAWLIDYLVDHGPQSEQALSSWVHEQDFDKEEFSRRVGDIHIGLGECLWRVRKAWRKPNGIHPGTGYPSFVYGLVGVHPNPSPVVDHEGPEVSDSAPNDQPVSHGPTDGPAAVSGSTPGVVTTVSAYDSVDNKRRDMFVKVGDEVDWKKDGVAGTYRCLVVGLGRVRVRVVLLYHTWSPAKLFTGQTPRWIGRRLHRVYPK